MSAEQGFGAWTSTRPHPLHDKRGKLRQRYGEGQEDQLGALGLVVNLVVLWNTIYMNAALNQPRAEGYEVLADDVARLSPLSFKHINMLGRYALLTCPTPSPEANSDRCAIYAPPPWTKPDPTPLYRFLFRCYSDPVSRLHY